MDRPVCGPAAATQASRAVAGTGHGDLHPRMEQAVGARSARQAHARHAGRRTRDPAAAAAGLRGGPLH